MKRRGGCRSGMVVGTGWLSESNYCKGVIANGGSFRGKMILEEE